VNSHAGKHGGFVGRRGLTRSCYGRDNAGKYAACPLATLLIHLKRCQVYDRADVCGAKHLLAGAGSEVGDQETVNNFVGYIAHSTKKAILTEHDSATSASSFAAFSSSTIQLGTSPTHYFGKFKTKTW
jgi:hypothetical protein